MVERDQQISAFAVALDRGSFDGNDVEFGIVIAVDQPHAATHRLHDVFFVGRGNVWDRQPGFCSDVFELRDGRLRGLRFRGGDLGKHKNTDKQFNPQSEPDFSA